MKNFWTINDKDYTNRVAFLFSEEITPNLSYDIFYGKVETDYPLRFEYKSGKVWRDILTRTYVTLFFVSGKFIEVLESNKLTGWAKYEIEIINKPVDITTTYYCLAILGRCENNLSNIKKDKAIKNWDGSDFFTIEGTSHILISEKAFNCLSNKKYKITNLEFEAFDDLLLYYLDERAYTSKKILSKTEI